MLACFRPSSVFSPVPMHLPYLIKSDQNERSVLLYTDVLASALSSFRAIWLSLRHPGPHRMSDNHSGLCPDNAGSTPLSICQKAVPRDVSTSTLEQNYAPLRITDLHRMWTSSGHTVYTVCLGLRGTVTQSVCSWGPCP